MKSQIKRNEQTKGISIEERMRNAVANNEPITDSAPMIYTEKKDGVLPEYDIRTDKFDIAIDATTKFDKSERAKDNLPQVEQKDNNEPKNAA